MFLTIYNPGGHIQARKGTKSGIKLGKMELGKRWELKDYRIQKTFWDKTWKFKCLTFFVLFE